MPDETRRKRAEPERSPMARIRAARGGLMSSFRLGRETGPRRVSQGNVPCPTTDSADRHKGKNTFTRPTIGFGYVAIDSTVFETKRWLSLVALPLF